jgi:hypothetical protein
LVAGLVASPIISLGDYVVSAYRGDLPFDIEPSPRLSGLPLAIVDCLYPNSRGTLAGLEARANARLAAMFFGLAVRASRAIARFDRALDTAARDEARVARANARANAARAANVAHADRFNWLATIRADFFNPVFVSGRDYLRAVLDDLVRPPVIFVPSGVRCLC